MGGVNNKKPERKTIESREPVCPRCGSTEVSEWSRASVQNGLSSITLDAVTVHKGEPYERHFRDVRPSDYDAVSRDNGEIGEGYEWWCRGCDYNSDRVADFYNEEPNEVCCEDSFEHLQELLHAVQGVGALLEHIDGHTRLGEAVRAGRNWVEDAGEDDPTLSLAAQEVLEASDGHDGVFGDRMEAALNRLGRAKR